MRRRALLRLGVSGFLSTAGYGALGVSTASGREPGIVWSRRGRAPGSQRLSAALRDPGSGFTFAGVDTASGRARTFLLATDRRGRPEGHRRGSDENGWGDRGSDLVATDDGLLLAGIEADSPALIASPGPLAPPEWSRTYDGTPAGAVHAATTGESHALGWTDAGAERSVVVGTDDRGARRWGDRTEPGRRLAELVSIDGAAVSLVAVGPHPSPSGGGWARAWGADGTRRRNLTYVTPGDGPEAAAADGAGLVLSGTAGDGWWLERRRSDWSVDWTRGYAGSGDDRGVDDLVVLSDGYGMLAHDAEAPVVVRTDGTGTERWRGRYAPHGAGVADRGLALLPVGGDEFVVAGTTSREGESPDWWLARVGEPGIATPVETPEPTPTPAPTTTPPLEPDTSSPGSTGTATPAPGSMATTSNPPTTWMESPGFAVPAAIGGLLAWLGLCRAGD